MEIITANIKKAFLQLQLVGREFSVQDIFGNYKGKPATKEVGTIQNFKEFLDKKKKLIGIDIQIKITQEYYGKVVQKKVCEEMERLMKNNNLMALSHQFISTA